MLSILHGSDLHFGEPYDPVVGEAFQVAARDLEPGLIVLSGDFTQRAKEREYEQARAYVDRLPDAPLVVTPGNHDIPLYRVFERLFTPYRNYRRYISDELDTVTRLEEAVVVSLNTASPLTAIVNGRLRDRQLEFARRAFDGISSDRTRIVVAHHHFAPAPDYEGGDDSLPRAREILDAFKEMKVDLVLGGHLHRAYIGNSLDVYPGEDRDHGIIIVQSGTTTSRRGRAREQAKNTFNLLRIAGGYVEITHYMYFEEAGSFAPLSVHVYPKRANRYFRADPFQPVLFGLLDEEGDGEGSEG